VFVCVCVCKQSVPLLTCSSSSGQSAAAGNERIPSSWDWRY